MGDARPEWYFDFISPFAYLQSARLAELPGPPPALRPVLFAGLLKHWGQLGPAEIAPKRSFTYRHVLWQARRRDVVLRFPPAHPFNPLAALRLAVACGSGAEVTRSIFDFVWRDGRDPNDDWPQLCARVGMAPEEARARIAEEAVKAELRDNTAAAIAAGVFGVPTLVIDGRLFWGSDATDMAADWIRDPDAFEDAEMRRVQALPVSTVRPRG